MNKKTIIAIITGVIILAGGVFLYLRYNPTGKTNAPLETKIPEEEVKVGSDNSNNTGKSLVVYFSVPETTDPNKKMTTEEENSTIIVDGRVLGNTEYIAMLIAENTSGYLYRIEPKTPYTINHSDLVSQAKEEQNKDLRPEIKNRISNFETFDIIYVGYPIWWETSHYVRQNERLLV